METAAAELGVAKPESAGGPGVSRREIEIPEKGRLIVFQPGAPSLLPSAPVFLLSAVGVPEERILAEWGSQLAPLRLTVLIPVNRDGTMLTDADIPLIIRALSAASGELKCDLRRAVFVSAAAQSELAWQMASEPGSPIRGVALTGGWIADSQLDDSLQADPSILFLPDPNLSAQESALRGRSIEQLRKRGLWIPEVETGAEAAKLIGEWTLWMRSL
jgi:hypothetical protein